MIGLLYAYYGRVGSNRNTTYMFSDGILYLHDPCTRRLISNSDRIVYASWLAFLIPCRSALCRCGNTPVARANNQFHRAYDTRLAPSTALHTGGLGIVWRISNCIRMIWIGNAVKCVCSCSFIYALGLSLLFFCLIEQIYPGSEIFPHDLQLIHWPRMSLC